VIEGHKIRVVVADDSPLSREGLVALIQNSAEMNIVGQAVSGAKACAMVRSLKPDIVVLNIVSQEMTGLAVAKRLNDEGLSTKAIILNFREDLGSFERAMEIGCRGYVLWRSASDNLLFAMRSVARGGLYIDPILADQIAGPSSRRRPNGPNGGHSRDGDSTLTSREEEVLRLIALGQTNKAIAAKLGVTDRSIAAYRASAISKLKLNSRSRIVAYGHSQGWFRDAQS
jgi:DNA-binding NarL/FixJ family response regulator